MYAEIALRRAALERTFQEIDRGLAALDPRPAHRAPSQLQARLYGLAVELPLCTDMMKPGQILDKGGDLIAVVNPRYMGADVRVDEIAALIVQAVNAAAGVKA